MKRSIVGLTIVGATAWSGAAAAQEAAPTRSVTIDVLQAGVGGTLWNLWGTYLEEQLATSNDLSVVVEEGYLEPSDYREPGGASSGLHTRMAIAAVGAVYWPVRPFDGPFLSVRPEAWLVSAEDAHHVVATGTQFDVNVQPGWQWNWDPFTLIAGASFAYASGPVTSADGSVAFPIHGFSGTPHLRVGVAWCAAKRDG